MRRAKWGIGAAAVVGLAWLISNFFNIDFGGIGTKDGARVALPTSSRSIAPTDPPEQTEPSTEPVAAVGREDSIGSGGVIEVLIDDRAFFVRRGTSEPAEWVAAEPDAVAAYARQAAGDDTGVRVRIFRKPSARASAEDDLVETLRGVGVTRAEIDVPERLVE